MKKIVTFLIAVVFMLNLTTAQNVGQIAPGFSLDDIDDRVYTLSANRGKVILVFLVGYNCPYCIGSAPTVNSKIISFFSDNSKFQTLVIDTWDGTTSGVKSFKNATELDALYLQNGSGVATSWQTTYDRLVVIDKDGIMKYKGGRSAKSDADDAKIAVQNALNTITTSVDILEDSDGFALGQNYPNPVQTKTKIEFAIGDAAEVTLSVFDITGKKVLVPVQQFYSPGSYEIYINRFQLNKGIYFYRLEAGSFSSIKKMVVQ